MTMPQAFESVKIYEATGEWPIVVRRWYNVFGNVEPISDRSVYGFPDVLMARRWVHVNFPRFELVPSIDDEEVVDVYMSQEAIAYALVYAPVLQQIVERATANQHLSFGEAYEQARVALKLTTPVPVEIERAILTAAFRMVTNKAFPPAGIRHVLTPAECVLCNASWDTSGPTCSCRH